MGWVWRDEPGDSGSRAGEVADSRAGEVSDSDSYSVRSAGDRCSTRKVMKSQCKTEEVEPGKFIRKCERTEEILRDCVGRPVEVIQSNGEFTEEDVTDQMPNNRSISSGSSKHGALDFPGLHSDLEAIERSFFGSVNHLAEAMEELKNGFFGAFGFPHLFDEESSSSPSMRRGVPIDDHNKPRVFPQPSKPNPGDVDLSGLARDV